MPQKSESSYSMANDRVWQGIVSACRDVTQDNINYGGKRRREAIMEMDRRLIAAGMVEEEEWRRDNPNG